MGFICDPSLALYIPLYQLDGGTFKSKDAYGHLCTVTGALWQLNGGLFDGVDDEVLIPDHTILDGQSAFSVEAWIYPTASDTNNTGIVVKRDAGGNLAWAVFLNANSTIKIDIVDVSAVEQAFNTILTAPDNEWSHVVMVWDGTTILAYINGVLDVGSQACASMRVTNADVLVGMHNAGSTYPFTGTIGEVRIYNQALTPLEIQHNYLVTKWRYR